jgi:hypothetical protein
MMATLIGVAALAAGAPDLGARIGEAAAAEQSLRGPFEGAWILRDAHGHVLYALQMSDPIDGPLGGAWRDLATNDLGVVDGGSRGGGLVQLKLTLHTHERAWLTLRPAGPARWRGRMIAAGRGAPVTLSRN